MESLLCCIFVLVSTVVVALLVSLLGLFSGFFVYLAIVHALWKPKKKKKKEEDKCAYILDHRDNKSHLYYFYYLFLSHIQSHYLQAYWRL